MARLYQDQGKPDELCDVLAEGARFETDPVARAALLARIGEIRMESQGDLSAAADAFREALDSTPDDPRAAGGAGTDRGAARGLVDTARGVVAPPGRHRGRRADSGAVPAGEERRGPAVGPGPGRRLPAPGAVDRRRQRDGVRWSWSASCGPTSAGTIWWTCWASMPMWRRVRAARRRSWPCAWPSRTSGSRTWSRPTAPPRRWRRCWRWRPTTSAPCCRWPAFMKRRSAGRKPRPCWSARPAP